jgi:hypothetical protein
MICENAGGDTTSFDRLVKATPGSQEGHVSLETEIADVLAAPLATLLDVTHQVLVGSHVDQWHLPPSDQRALRAWGLPDGPLFRPGLQNESAPVLVPNASGEWEQQIIEPQQRLYLLGSYGSEHVVGGEDVTLRVGAVAGGGRVLGIRSRPLTVEDIAQPLRAHYSDFSQPAVQFFNSSVAAFVEVAWRWRAAVMELRRYPCPDEEGEGAVWFDRKEAALQQVLAGMVRIDHALADPQLDSIWVETITKDY